MTYKGYSFEQISALVAEFEYALLSKKFGKEVADIYTLFGRNVPAGIIAQKYGKRDAYEVEAIYDQAVAYLDNYGSDAHEQKLPLPEEPAGDDAA